MANQEPVPKSAPAKAMPVTAHGPTPKGGDGHEPVPARIPPPASAGTTGPIEAGPSVNYDANQETPQNVLRLPNAVIPLGEQDQRT